jgi:hypothetical protein
LPGESYTGFCISLYKTHKSEIPFTDFILYINHDGVRVSYHTLCGDRKAIVENLPEGNTSQIFSDFSCRILNDMITKLNNAEEPNNG